MKEPVFQVADQILGDDNALIPFLDFLLKKSRKKDTCDSSQNCPSTMYYAEGSCYDKHRKQQTKAGADQFWNYIYNTACTYPLVCDNTCVLLQTYFGRSYWFNDKYSFIKNFYYVKNKEAFDYKPPNDDGSRNLNTLDGRLSPSSNKRFQHLKTTSPNLKFQYAAVGYVTLAATDAEISETSKKNLDNVLDVLMNKIKELGYMFNFKFAVMKLWYGKNVRVRQSVLKHVSDKTFDMFSTKHYWESVNSVTIDTFAKYVSKLEQLIISKEEFFTPNQMEYITENVGHWRSLMGIVQEVLVLCTAYVKIYLIFQDKEREEELDKAAARPSQFHDRPDPEAVKPQAVRKTKF